MELDSNWNYDISVSKIKPILFRWKNMTIEIVKELYIARNQLSISHRPLSGANAPLTWNGYCKDIGMAKSTINRWLLRYIPEENKLLTHEEYETIKKIEIEDNKSKEQKEKERRSKAYDEERKEFDKNYKSENKTVYDDKDKQKRYEKHEEVRDWINGKEEKAEIKDEQKEQRDRLYEDMKKRTEEYFEEQTDKIKFKQKHLSKVNNLNTFYDVINDYVSTLDNVSRKIEAFNGIIKYCRDMANKMHRET